MDLCFPEISVAWTQKCQMWRGEVGVKGRGLNLKVFLPDPKILHTIGWIHFVAWVLAGCWLLFTVHSVTVSAVPEASIHLHVFEAVVRWMNMLGRVSTPGQAQLNTKYCPGMENYFADVAEDGAFLHCRPYQLIYQWLIFLYQNLLK